MKGSGGKPFARNLFPLDADVAFQFIGPTFEIITPRLTTDRTGNNRQHRASMQAGATIWSEGSVK